MGNAFDRAEKKLSAFDRAEMKMGPTETIPEGGEWPTSAITGKPMLSSMEKVQAGKEGALEALPIMGDIAGSMLAPQKKLLTSAPKVANLAWKGANVLSRGIGSGIGSGAGEEWKQEFLGESDPQAIMDQAKLGFAGEVGTSIVMGTLKPLYKPLHAIMSKVTTAGAVVTNKVRKNLIKDTIENAENFVNDIAPGIVKQTQAKLDINQIGEAAVETLSENKAVYNLFNKEVDNMARKEDGYVILGDTSQLLTDKGLDIEDVYGWPAGTKQNKIMKNLIKDEMIHPEDFKSLLMEFWKGKKAGWKNLDHGQRATREKLKDTMLKDIARRNPKAALLKGQADDVLREVSRFQQVNRMYERAIWKAPSGDTFLNPSRLAKEIRASKRMDMPQVVGVFLLQKGLEPLHLGCI